MTRFDVPNPTSHVPFAHTDLDAQYGLSAFGLVLQLSRLNLLVPQDAFSAFGIRMRYSEDWSFRLALSEGAQSAIRARVRVAEVVSSAWGIAPWQPFAGPTFTNSAPWQLRVCLPCLQYGYHSNLFQMPWLTRCPWHGSRLLINCDHCGRPLGSGIKRDMPMLLCECGSDGIKEQHLLDYHQPFEEERNHYVGRYLRWAELRRRSTVLFGTVLTDSSSEAVLRWLIRLPKGLSRVSDTHLIHLGCAIHTRTMALSKGEADSALGGDEKLRASLASFGLRTPTFVELPLSCADPMAQVSRSLALSCPSGSLSMGERKQFGLPPEPDQPKRSSRAALLLLPAYVVTGRLFFDARVLSREVHNVLVDICRSYLARRYPDPHTEDMARRLYERTLGLVLRKL